jgi:hypothetical protein
MSHLYALKSRLIETVIYIIYTTGKIFLLMIKILGKNARDNEIKLRHVTK